MTQDKLKSMREFRVEVKDGDIVRIVLDKGEVLAGHIHWDQAGTFGEEVKTVRISISQDPRLIEDEIERAYNPHDYIEFQHCAEDPEFVYKFIPRGVGRGRKILGYEVLKRAKKR